MKRNNRLDWKLYFSNIALSSALRATCPKISVGAVLVKNKEIVSTGYNGAPKGMKHCTEVGCILDKSGHCIRSVHAEANAIIRAKTDTYGAELFCTHFPCIECCKLILNAGIVKVYYIYEYVDERSLELGYHSQSQFLKEGKVKVEKISYSDLILPNPSDYWVSPNC